MVLEVKCFHGVGAFEVYLLKVSALKLSHPSACPVFKDFSLFSQLRHSLEGEGDGDGRIGVKNGRKGILCLKTVVEVLSRGCP
jgi:hypothetical protein